MLNEERGFMTKMNNLIPKNARYIMSNLMKYGKQGEETYLVGGCVRDVLLNRKPKELKNTEETTKLVKICTEYNEDIDAINGSIIVDAKSIIGVTSMGATLRLRINTNNKSVKDEFYSKIQEEFDVI